MNNSLAHSPSSDFEVIHFTKYTHLEDFKPQTQLPNQPNREFMSSPQSTSITQPNLTNNESSLNHSHHNTEPSINTNSSNILTLDSSTLAITSPKLRSPPFVSKYSNSKPWDPSVNIRSSSRFGRTYEPNPKYANSHTIPHHANHSIVEPLTLK